MKIRTIIIILALLAFLTASVGGVLFYYSMMDSMLVEANRDIMGHMEEMSDRVALSLAEYQKITAAMAGLKEMRGALERKDPAALQEANGILDQFQHALDADACFLLDRSGNAIASSNRNTAESFVGKNYAFRPYFKKSLDGKPSPYPALGLVTQKRGVFYSHPVYQHGQKAPVGVVVIKKSTDYLDREIGKKGEGVMMLVNPRGVIFISNRADWLYHVLWKTSPDALAEIAETRQFGTGPFEWTGMERTDAQHAVSVTGKRYLVHQRRIVDFPGWDLVYLHDLGLVSDQASTLFFKNYGYFFAMLCVLIAVASIFLYQKASTEINKRKKAEEDLQGSNDRLQALIKRSPLSIIIVDRGGIVTLWNPAAERVYGWSEQEILGKFLFIVPEEKRDEFIGFLRRVFRGETFRAVETQRVKKDGARLNVSLSMAPLHDAQGNVVEAMGICEDMTDRKKAEEERMKGHVLESIGLLASGIAHDFNNLLTVIVGNVRLVKMSVQPGDAAFSRLSDAENVCEMAGELTKKLVAFATGGDPMKKPASLSGLLAETVNSVLVGSNITAEISLPVELHLVAIDEGQMKQVFRNLAINAIEAMPQGGTLSVQGENIHVAAQSAFPLREGHYLKITLRDTGVGIPSENLAKIFDPYYSTKDVYSQKGLGLGLAVCYSVIKRHGGLITVESEVGKGTAYHIYLPAAG